MIIFVGKTIQPRFMDILKLAPLTRKLVLDDLELTLNLLRGSKLTFEKVGFLLNTAGHRISRLIC